MPCLSRRGIFVYSPYIDNSAMSSTLDERHVYHVSELNRDVRTLLERGFPLLWVEGEISNFSRPSSGHWYFSLKDSKAQVGCAMFKNRNRFTGFTPENGMQVLIRARVTLYEPQGRFQLIAEDMEEAGAGALQRAFDQLKTKLQQEGLFAAERKQAPPALPRRVGVITSPTGAAIRDVLSVLKRRFPALPVLIYPVAVQGEGAAQQIASAIHRAGSDGRCDVLLLVRGGGSLEDLWSFNEEIVARAIADCPVPLVAGVGHEVDFTIADFVADRRAPTPSAAAELISPDAGAWRGELDKLQWRMGQALRHRLTRETERLRHLSARLQHPSRRLEQQSQKLDDLERRLHQSLTQTISRRRQRLENLDTRLWARQPGQRLDQAHSRLDSLGQRLQQNMLQRLRQNRQQLAGLGRALEAVSPLATLERGYAICTDEAGRVVKEANKLTVGARVTTRLHRGALHCKVEKIDAHTLADDS